MGSGNGRVTGGGGPNDGGTDAINSQLRGLAKSINTSTNKNTLDDPTYALDNQTRADINNLINKRDLAGATSLWHQAMEGVDPKFKARQATQALYTTLLDQPGASQTRTASLLDAYKGR